MAFTQKRAHENKTLTTAQQTTLQIPVGGKIQNLMLCFFTSAGVPVTEAQVRAEIANIQLTINGRDIVNADAIAIYDAYEALGVDVATNTGIAGAVELNIGRLIFERSDLRNAYGFGTADISSIQVRVTAGTLAAIASVTAYTSRTAVTENLGQHCRFIAYPRSFNAASADTFDTLPRDIDSAYLAVMMSDGASGAISSGEVRVNGQVLQENLPTAVNTLVMSTNRHVNVSGYYVYDFSDGTPSGSLPMLGANDLRFITTFGTAPGAGGYTAYALTINNIPTAAQ